MLYPRPTVLGFAAALAMVSLLSSLPTVSSQKILVQTPDAPGSAEDEEPWSLMTLVPTDPPGDAEESHVSMLEFTTVRMDSPRRPSSSISSSFVSGLSEPSGAIRTVDVYIIEQGSAVGYIKTIEVGGREVLRFTHKFNEERLLIEIDRDLTESQTVSVVKDLLGEDVALEQISNLAYPRHLFCLLKAAVKRFVDSVPVNEGGSALASSANFLELVSLHVEQFDPAGRPFFAALAISDDLPDVGHWEPSLFINEESLLAAAASAYVQRYIESQGEVRLGAIEQLLEYEGPVGVVLAAESAGGYSEADHSETDYVDIPKGTALAWVVECTDDKIVLDTLSLNPVSRIFLDKLQYNWVPNAARPADLQTMPDSVTLRRVDLDDILGNLGRMQTWLLDRFLRRGSNHRVLSDSDVRALAGYEFIAQALKGVAGGKEETFELQKRHVAIVSSLMAPSWLLVRLDKLMNSERRFASTICSDSFLQRLVDAWSGLGECQSEIPDFAQHIMAVMARELVEAERDGLQLRRRLEVTKEGEGHRIDGLQRELNLLRENYQESREELASARQEMQKLSVLKAEPELSGEARYVLHGQLASKLGEVDLDEVSDIDEQERAVHERIDALLGAEEKLKNILAYGRSQAHKELVRVLGVLEEILGIDVAEGADEYERQREVLDELEEFFSQSELTAVENVQDFLDELETTLDMDVDSQKGCVPRLERIQKRLEEGEIDGYLDDLEHLLEVDNNRRVDVLPDREERVERINNWINQKIGAVAGEVVESRESSLLDIERALHLSPVENDSPEARVEAVSSLVRKKLDEVGPKPGHVLVTEVDNLTEEVESIKHQLIETRKALLSLRGRDEIQAQPAGITDERLIDLNRELVKLQQEFGLEVQEGDSPFQRLGALEEYTRREGIDREFVSERIELAAKSLEIDLGDANNFTAGQYLEAIGLLAATHGKQAVAYQPAVEGEITRKRDVLQRIDSFFQREQMLREELDAHMDSLAEHRDELQMLEAAGSDSRDQVDFDNIEKERLLFKVERAEVLLSSTRQALYARMPESLDELETDLVKELGASFDHKGQTIARFSNLRQAHSKLSDRLQQLSTNVLTLQLDEQLLALRLKDREQALTEAQTLAASVSPFYGFAPSQRAIVKAVDDFIGHDTIREMAINSAVGLAKASEYSTGESFLFADFNFFQPDAAVRMRGLVGEELSFAQAGRITEVFRTLYLFDFKAFQQADELAERLLDAEGRGPRVFDDYLQRRGDRALHYRAVCHDEFVDFADYLAHDSANMNRLMTLFDEGSIHKSELLGVMTDLNELGATQCRCSVQKELRIFLVGQHGVNMGQLADTVEMLSDEDIVSLITAAFKRTKANRYALTGMVHSIERMKAFAIIYFVNSVLNSVAFDDGRWVAVVLTDSWKALHPLVRYTGLTESQHVASVHSLLLDVIDAPVSRKLFSMAVKPAAFFSQVAIWYYINYKPLTLIYEPEDAKRLAFLGFFAHYVLDLTHRGDHLHRFIAPFDGWIEYLNIDRNRTEQYAFHRGVETLTGLFGLVMPFGAAASSYVLLSAFVPLFARQYHAFPGAYRLGTVFLPSVDRSKGWLTGMRLPILVSAAFSRQGVQVPLLHHVVPQVTKTVASSLAGVVLGPLSVIGAYVYGVVYSGSQIRNLAVIFALGAGFDFLLNDNAIAASWLAGPVGKEMDALERWLGYPLSFIGEREVESQHAYAERVAVSEPQRYGESDDAFFERSEGQVPGWLRRENFMQFRARRDLMLRSYYSGWEQYFGSVVPLWSFSHKRSIPYGYTLGVLLDWYYGNKLEVSSGKTANADPVGVSSPASLQSPSERGEL